MNASRSDVDVLHEIGSRLATASPLHAVLSQVVNVVSTLVRCDSCFVYVLQDTDLVLRASNTPHPDVVDRLKLRVGQGITGWVAEHGEPVAVSEGASLDPRFQAFHDLPEDRYEAFLSVPVLSRGKLVGVINLQHEAPHVHGREEIQLISTIGFLVGAEIEMARLESENTALSGRLEERKLIDRAKAVLQRDLGISEEDAYLSIQKESRHRRRSKKDVAEAILLSDEMRRGRGPG
jgi:uroporphyrinogen-III synthase